MFPGCFFVFYSFSRSWMTSVAPHRHRWCGQHQVATSCVCSNLRFCQVRDFLNFRHIFMRHSTVDLEFVAVRLIHSHSGCKANKRTTSGHLNTQHTINTCGSNTPQMPAKRLLFALSTLGGSTFHDDMINPTRPMPTTNACYGKSPRISR